MRERPILFSGDMVRAILDGSKTQTRRIVKPQPPATVMAADIIQRPAYGGSAIVWLGNTVMDPLDGTKFGGSYKARHPSGWKCPYGQPDDRLWVREAFDPIYPQDLNYSGGRPIEIDYRATPTERMKDKIGMRRWKPSIHMPRWASRITLEITGIRVERLQDGNVEDYYAEGVAVTHATVREHGCKASMIKFSEAWEQIYGAGTWEKNPWVWVIEFKKL